MRQNEASLDAPHVWTVLAKCYHTLSLYVERSIESKGLCISDFAVLEVLLHKGPLSISEIGAKVLLTSGSMTAAVDRLEKRELVYRATTQQDRRTRVVHLTDQGHAFIVPVFQKHKADLETAMDGLDDQQKTALYALLRQLGLFVTHLLKQQK